MAYENALIAHGYGSQSGTDSDFTSDALDDTELTAYDEDADFPVANIQQYDPGEPWRSPATPPTANIGDRAFNAGTGLWDYSTWIKFDLGVEREIKLFALLNHNIHEMRLALHAVIPGIEDFGVYLEADVADGTWTPPPWSANLTGLFDLDWPGYRTKLDIVHRPEASYKWWRFVIKWSAVGAWDPPDDAYWSIGRMFLAGDVWQPSYNFQAGWATRLHDPSIVSYTAGQARRVTELAQFRSLSLPFSNMTETDWQSLQWIFSHQGTKHPIFISPEPHLIKTGENAPLVTDFDREAFYGYLDETFTVARSRANSFGFLTVNATEVRG